MSRFKCTNSSCENNGKEVIIEKVRWIWDKQKSEMVLNNPVVCITCGCAMEYIINTGPITCNFNKFDSLTTTEKRRIIHKRSMDHFNKHDKGDLANYKKKIIDDNRNRALGKR